MRAAEFSFRGEQLRETEVRVSNPQGGDPYRSERRIDTAARWNDIRMALGWGGVLFNNGMPCQWFKDIRASKQEWSKIVEQIQSVRPRFDEIVTNQIPDFSPIILSRDIAC